MPLMLWRRSLCSFDASDIYALANWLRSQGYTDQSVRYHTERARLACDGVLVTCYHSGAAVCQGRNQTAGLALLSTLLIPEDT